MNEMQSLRQWAIGAALGLALSQIPFGIMPAHAANELLQQALTQQGQIGSQGQLPVEEFYQLRNETLAWQSESAVEALVAALNTLESDGLNPADYRADRLMSAFQNSQNAGESAQAAFDIQATQALLLALDHLERGKVNPRDVEPSWDVARPERHYSLLRVTHAVDDQDLERAFSLARPASSEYQQLREALSQYRHIATLGSAPYLGAREESLRPGDVDDDVTTLRQRLTLWGKPACSQRIAVPTR